MAYNLEGDMSANAAQVHGPRKPLRLLRQPELARPRPRARQRPRRRRHCQRQSADLPHERQVRLPGIPPSHQQTTDPPPRRQYFHTDGADLVGLLCISKALRGGESDIASTHHIYNTLQREHPDVVQTLATPNWYFDRKGEVSQGQEPWYKSSILYTERDSARVWLKFDPNNVTSLARFNSGPDAKIPALSEAQKHALAVLEETATRLALHMVLEPGDIQLLANGHVLHARTAYEDWPAGSVDEEGRERVRRHLFRLGFGLC